jgi:hypothetical protein
VCAPFMWRRGGLVPPFHGIRTAQARPLPSIVAAMQIFVKTGKQHGSSAVLIWDTTPGGFQLNVVHADVASGSL